MAPKPDVLQSQIDLQRNEIHTDQYPMSIGELANLYRDGELDIHPEFQRFYRWDSEQKSRFIESILLGIPIPSIFVSQREDGNWDVIDGLQRLSTLFHLMGILVDQDDKLVRPLILTKTKFLPALEGKQWKSGKPNESLSTTQQLLIRRAKLDLKIVLRESGENAKYELFQRLNTGGSDLSEQEIRNAMLVSANPEFHEWLNELTKCDGFAQCVLLSDRQLLERYDMELVLRFIALGEKAEQDLKSVGHLADYLTEEMLKFSNDFEKKHKKYKLAFESTFDYICGKIGKDAFRKYDSVKERYSGAFSVSAFEAIALGVGYHFLTKGTKMIDNPEVVAKKLWANSTFVDNSGSGFRASQRIPYVVPLGRKLFGSKK